MDLDGVIIHDVQNLLLMNMIIDQEHNVEVVREGIEFNLNDNIQNLEDIDYEDYEENVDNENLQNVDNQNIEGDDIPNLEGDENGEDDDDFEDDDDDDNGEEDEDSQNGSQNQEEDDSENESESDEEDYLEDYEEIDFSSPLFLKWSSEFNVLFPEYKEFLKIQIEDYLEDKFFSNVSKTMLSQIVLNVVTKYDFMEHFITNPRQKMHFNMAQDLFKRFLNSSTLQNAYIHTFYDLIPPVPISKEMDYGWMVPPEKLIQHALKDDILKTRILEEKNIMTVESDGWTSNIPDLCGSEDRRNNMVGSVRIVIGADDIRPYPRSNKKILMVYLDISNIPIEFRRSETSGYTFAMLDREAIDHHFDKKNPNKLNEAMKPIVERLKNLVQNGIEIENLHFDVKVSGFSCDNLGANELLGLSMNFGLGFACRNCPVNHKSLLTGTGNRWLRMEFSYENDSHPRQKRSFVFEKIPFIKPLNAIPFDVFHDIAEGVGEFIVLENLFATMKEENVTNCLKKLLFFR